VGLLDGLINGDDTEYPAAGETKDESPLMPDCVRLCPVVSLAPGGETDKYSVCAATYEIANWCHAEHGSRGSAGTLLSPSGGNGPFPEKFTGAGIGSAGGDDCGVNCERDCAAAEGQPG